MVEDGHTHGDADSASDDPATRELTTDAAAHGPSLQLNCGVVGVFGIPNAADVAALGLHALQHRGQEACGVAAFGGETFTYERHPGLVRDHFGDGKVSRRLPGRSAIAHCRYSTMGKDVLRNVQPLYADLQTGGLAIAHNGNLTNARTLREQLVARGSIFQSVSDTEVILHLAAASSADRLIDRFVDALDQIEGGYALVALADDMLIGARDPVGIRPLVLGRRKGAPVLASETCALDQIDAEFVRDIGPGEVVVADADGVRVHRAPLGRARPCAFEFIYFARPDSVMDSVSVYEARRRMGRRLAMDAPADADIVIPVPDGGAPAALGYAEVSGLPYEIGIIRSHFVGRTFIQPNQERRTAHIRLKHSANRAVVQGKRVVLIDDSIVRGNTSRKIVQLVRDAGATEVHFRSASPPIRYPDYYGIDMPAAEELLARRVPDLRAMADELHADSVDFLSVESLYHAVTDAPRDRHEPQLTDHYFTGEYPTPLTDLERPGDEQERQMSFLDAG